MASRNKDERAHVNALVKAVIKNSPDPGVYIFIDRDAGNVRHTSSGWDFQISKGGRVVYCEAKVENGKLSSWQEFTRASILAAGTPYYVVRFWREGKYFSIDDGRLIGIDGASVADFIKI
jgi:hypothetical protein